MSCCPSYSSCYSSCCPSYCCPTVCCPCPPPNPCPTSGVGISTVLFTDLLLTPAVATLAGPLVIVNSNKVTLVGTNTFQVQVAGPYTINASVAYQLSSAATVAFTTTTTVQVNGVTLGTATSALYPIGTTTGVTGPNFANNTALKTTLAVGDLVTFLVTASTPGTPTISLDSSSSFSMASSC